MRLRGRKNWTPIFQAYLTPKEAKKAIKSILAKTFNFRHFSDITHQTILCMCALPTGAISCTSKDKSKKFCVSCPICNISYIFKLIFLRFISLTTFRQWQTTSRVRQNGLVIRCNGIIPAHKSHDLKVKDQHKIYYELIYNNYEWCKMICESLYANIFERRAERVSALNQTNPTLVKCHDNLRIWFMAVAEKLLVAFIDQRWQILLASMCTSFINIIY